MQLLANFQDMAGDFVVVVVHYFVEIIIKVIDQPLCICVIIFFFKSPSQERIQPDGLNKEEAVSQHSFCRALRAAAASQLGVYLSDCFGFLTCNCAAAAFH